MKLKENVVEKEGMNKELYDLFIELIKLEYNKCNFVKSAKFYCWAHGLQDCCNFFKVMMDTCNHCKNDFVFYLLGRFEEIPEIQLDAFKTDFKSAEEVFTDFVEYEENFVDLIERIVTKAKELDDVNAMSFALPIVNKIDHIACRALEAVKNDKSPLELVEYYCADYIKG